MGRSPPVSETGAYRLFRHARLSFWTRPRLNRSAGAPSRPPRDQISPRAKSEISCGVAVSKPTTSTRLEPDATEGTCRVPGEIGHASLLSSRSWGVVGLRSRNPHGR
jgi:hypothetical protein